MKSLNGKVAVVTGAANGLGRSLAFLLAKEKAHLALLDIDEKQLNETKEAIGEEGIKVKVYPVDIADQKAVEQTASQIASDFSSIDILINNAGVSINFPFTAQRLEDFKWVTEVNYLGTVYCCYAFYPFLAQQNIAAIVNVSSGAAFQPLPRRTAYCGSKFAIRGFSQAFQMELWGSNIQLSVAYPGPIKTSMPERGKFLNEKDRKKDLHYLTNQGYPPDWVAQKIIKGIQKRRKKILIGNEVVWGYHFKRWFPEVMNYFIARFQNKLPF